jgi:DNA-binding PadR family transcriptional regulator
MAGLTNAEMAVLGLVAEQPRHGYDIERAIEAREMREWTEVGFSSIYFLLKKLEGKGLVAGRRMAPGRGPARRVYRATPAGRAALRAAILHSLAVPVNSHPPIQLALANLPAVPRPDAVAALEHYRDGLRRRLEHIHTRRSLGPLPDHVLAMFDLSAAAVQAEIGWATSFLRRLRSRPPRRRRGER